MCKIGKHGNTDTTESKYNPPRDPHHTQEKSKLHPICVLLRLMRIYRQIRNVKFYFVSTVAVFHFHKCNGP